VWLFADAISDQLIKWISNPSGASLTAVLALLILGLMTGRIVPGWVHDAVVKERDTLRARSDTLLETLQHREEVERQVLMDRQSRAPQEAG